MTFALSLSTSTAANELVDDDDDGPLLTPLQSQAEMSISSNSVTRAAIMRLLRYCGTEGRSERVTSQLSKNDLNIYEIIC